LLFAGNRHPVSYSCFLQLEEGFGIYRQKKASIPNQQGVEKAFPFSDEKKGNFVKNTSHFSFPQDAKV